MTYTSVCTAQLFVLEYLQSQLLLISFLRFGSFGHLIALIMFKTALRCSHYLI